MSFRFLSYAEVLILHQSQIELFGGLPGLRNKALLESALAQPERSFGGQLIHATLVDMAAAYLFHIVKNHAFVDGMSPGWWV